MASVIVNGVKPPCKIDCENRSGECHSICEEWKIYETQHQKELADRIDAINKNMVLHSRVRQFMSEV